MVQRAPAGSEQLVDELYRGHALRLTRMALLLIYVLVSALIIWGADHYRSIASHHREISKRLTE